MENTVLVTGGAGYIGSHAWKEYMEASEAERCTTTPA